MAQAYVLAGEFYRAGDDYRLAYERYERVLRPLVEQKQVDTRGSASTFAPKTAVRVWARNQATKLLAVPVVGDRLLSRQLIDSSALPAYGIKAAAGFGASPPELTVYSIRSDVSQVGRWERPAEL